MAPSLINTVGVVAAAFVAGTSATKSYKIADKYSSSNFYSKWNFVTTDPNNGYVEYQSQQGANDHNLVQLSDDGFYLGVDYNQAMPDTWTRYPGRRSVRVESQQTYNHGLFIGDFSHLPKPTCGTWPAFWMFGSKGEFDFLENWNDLTFNRITAHANNGLCTIKQSDMSASVVTNNCADIAPPQYDYQACSANSYDGVFGSDTGGVYATEWTSEYIRLWSWKVAPDDVQAGKPDPSTWGKPMFQVSDCNIDQNFADLKFILNINFCSVANQPDKWGATDGCATKTGKDTCMEYVASNGAAFQDSFFKVKGISVYELTEDPQTSTTSSTTTPSSTPSSTVLSTTSSTPVSSDLPSATATTSASAAASASDASASVSDSAPASASVSTSDASFASVSATASASIPDSASASSSGSTSASVSDSASVTGVTASDSSATNVPTASVTTPADNDQQSLSTSAFPTLSVSAPYKNGTISSSQLSLTPTVDPSSATQSSGAQSSGAQSSDAQFTTSTEFATRVYTVTSCAPTVTNCPVGSVTTETVALYTTVCPVSDKNNSPKPTPPTFLTQTAYVTNIYTITSCPRTVTNCPVGSVTTEVGTTTKLMPVATPTAQADSPVYSTVTRKVTNVYTITSCAPTVTNCPVGSLTTQFGTQTTVVPVVNSPGANGSPNGSPNTKTDVYPVVGPTGSNVNGGSDNGKTTTIVSTAHRTKTITIKPASSVVPSVGAAAAPSAASNPTTDAEVAVYVTATVVPVGPSAPAIALVNALVNSTTNGTANASLSKPVMVSAGTPAAGCTGSDCKVPATSGNVRNGVASAAFVVVAGLFALAF
ncbi:Endo-1-3(4)-beta-glucanase [Apiospora aurea]|uniref:Endo-1-3(4)-beta-glucanase n=1 Tax=Apiospora aurea TaxID=335848 RepID=A0ABR1QEA7_9PEZI